jgi:hypothetical protein
MDQLHLITRLARPVAAILRIPSAVLSFTIACLTAYVNLNPRERTRSDLALIKIVR